MGEAGKVHRADYVAFSPNGRGDDA